MESTKKLQQWDEMRDLVKGNPVLQYHFENQSSALNSERKVDWISLLPNKRLKVQVKRKKRTKIVTVTPKHLGKALLNTCEMKPKPKYACNPKAKAVKTDPPQTMKLGKSKKKRTKNAGLIIPQEILSKRQKLGTPANLSKKGPLNPFSNSKLQNLLDRDEFDESNQTSNKLAAFLTR